MRLFLRHSGERVIRRSLSPSPMLTVSLTGYGIRPEHSTTCPPTSRSCSRSTGSRSPPYLTWCTKRHRQLKFPRLQPGGLRAAADRRVRQLYAEGTTRRRVMIIGLHRRISAHALPGPRPGPDHHQAAWPRRRVVDSQGPHRPAGPRPPRHRRLGRQRACPGQRPAGTQRMRPGPGTCRTTPPRERKQHGRPPPGVHRGTPAPFH
jgi:hypothetical protein